MHKGRCKQDLRVALGWDLMMMMLLRGCWDLCLQWMRGSRGGGWMSDDSEGDYDVVNEIMSKNANTPFGVLRRFCRGFQVTTLWHEARR